MISNIRKLALAALAVVFFAATGPVSAAELAVIEKRQALMKDVVLKNFKVIKGFVEKGEGSAADVGKAATALSAAAAQMPPLFPEGTGRGDVDAKKTRAMPEIWLDWDKFVAGSKVLGTEAAKLAEVAATGDKGAIAAQFGVTGKKGCGGCHKPFRGDKIK